MATQSINYQREYNNSRYSHHEIPSIISRISSVVRNCFRTIGHWFAFQFGHQDPITNPFFTSTMTFRSKMEIVQMIESIPETDREEVTHNALKLIRLNMSVSQKNSMILLVRDLPSQERTALVDLALRVYPSTHLLRNVILTKHVVATIQTIPVMDRESFTACATQYINKKNDYLGEQTGQLLTEFTTEIWPTLQNINPQDRSEIMQQVVQSMASCSRDDQLLTHLKQILIRVVSIPTEDRREIMQQVLRFQPPSNIQDLEMMIETIQSLLADISPARRDQVLQNALPLIPPGTTLSQAIHLIQCIAQLPEQETNDILRYANQLIHAEMDVFNKTMIINAIASLPIEQRAQYVQQRNAAARGVNVYEGYLDQHHLDQQVRTAIQRLYKPHGPIMSSSPAA